MKSVDKILYPYLSPGMRTTNEAENDAAKDRKGEKLRKQWPELLHHNSGHHYRGDDQGHCL
jgi:hypothetical protein